MLTFAGQYFFRYLPAPTISFLRSETYILPKLKPYTPMHCSEYSSVMAATNERDHDFQAKRPAFFWGT